VEPVVSKGKVTVQLTEPQLEALWAAAVLADTCCEQDGPESIGWTPAQYRALTNAMGVLHAANIRERPAREGTS
jgi:hypothetical protein